MIWTEQCTDEIETMMARVTPERRNTLSATALMMFCHLHMLGLMPPGFAPIATTMSRDEQAKMIQLVLLCETTASFQAALDFSTKLKPSKE